MSLFLFDKPLSWILDANQTNEYKSNETNKHIDLVRDYNKSSSSDHTNPQNGMSDSGKPLTPDDLMLKFIQDKSFIYYMTGKFELKEKAEIDMNFIFLANNLEKQSVSTIVNRTPPSLPPRMYDRDPYTDRIIIHRTRGENFNELRKAYIESSAQVMIQIDENGKEREIYVTTNV